jgi:two-component system nitrogen regulation sensor histidine kinase GlnL
MTTLLGNHRPDLTQIVPGTRRRASVPPTRGAPDLAARYTHLLDQIGEAVLLVDPDTHAIVEVSTRAATLTGISLPQLLDLALDALFSSPAVGLLLAELANLAPGATRTIRRVGVSGGRHPVVDARISVLEEHGRRLLHVVLSDIGEVRRLENVLAERDHVLNALSALAALAAAPGEHVLTQAVSAALPLLQARTGALYIVQDGQLRIIAGAGTTDTLPLTLDPEVINHRFDLDLLPLAGGEALLATRPEEPGRIATDPGADALRAALAGVLSAVLSAYLARRDAAAARTHLARTGEFQHVTLQSIGSAVIVLDGEGRVAHVNAAAARLLGYDMQEIVRMPYRNVLVTRRPIAQWIEPALQGQPAGPFELLLINRGGEELPVNFLARPVHGAEDDPPGVLLILEDLSQHRETDEHLRDLDRLQFLAEVSPVLAHEIRNPLTAIHAGVQYMATKIPADDPLRETIDLMKDESRRLNVLFGDFLAAARPVELRLMPCPLADLLEGLLHRRSAELNQRNIIVRRQYAPETLPALADRTKLEQVFANLIDNAMQAMDHDGVLTIEVLPGDPGGPPRVQARVSDSGPGIAPEAADQIWRPFFTTKQGGTGLGLPISKRIVNAHNGAIAVQSFPGSGTIFTVALPAAAGAPES